MRRSMVYTGTFHIMLTSDKLPAKVAEVHLLHLIGDKIVEITGVLLVIILEHLGYQDSERMFAKVLGPEQD